MKVIKVFLSACALFTFTKGALIADQNDQFISENHYANCFDRLENHEHYAVQAEPRFDQCCFDTDCCSQGRFFVRGDVLYWTPRISGLELDFGSSSIVEGVEDCTQILTTREVDRDPHFNWNAGYRVGAGYEKNNCGIGALWTHFQESGKRGHHHDGVNNLDRGKVKIKFDQIDLAFAYNYQATCSLAFRPFIGVRGARIHHHVRALSITNISLVADTDALETRTLNDKQKYWGVGPLFGLEGNWEIGKGFGIYGTLAGSLLYGEYKIDFDDSDIFSGAISKQIFSVNNRHMHGFDYNMDLAVGIFWHTALLSHYELNMKLGFEQHQYFNLNRLAVGRGDVSFTGLVFSLGLGF